MLKQMNLVFISLIFDVRTMIVWFGRDSRDLKLNLTFVVVVFFHKSLTLSVTESIDLT